MEQLLSLFPLQKIGDVRGKDVQQEYIIRTELTHLYQMKKINKNKKISKKEEILEGILTYIDWLEKNYKVEIGFNVDYIKKQS